jgi:hypothetical protein
MQPTNADDAGRRPCASLLAATMDRKLSRGRLQLISHPLGGQHLHRESRIMRTPLMRLAALTLSTAACGDSLEPTCLPVERPAVEVEIRDAQTEEFRADSARGVAQDGTYADSLQIVRYHSAEIVPAALGGAYGRPGTYTLRIERAGYQPWDTVGIHVQADRCGPITVQLVARLSPAP